MRKIHFFILSFLISCLFGSNANALELKDIEPIEVGALRVWPIRDADVTMEERLLPGLKDFPEYKDAFSRGPLPAVDQVFLVQDGNRLALIDTGWCLEGKVKGRTLDILKDNAIEPKQITDILLTHMDIDHIGGLIADGKAVFPNAALWISRPEFDAWIKTNLPNRPEFSKQLAKKIAQLYNDRIKLFNYGEQILPGITAIDAAGHTPGHTAYDIENDGVKLTIAGDTIHIWQIQLPQPELSSIYDIDMEKAAQTRTRLLERAANEKSLFGGMHCPMISPVIKRNDGGFNLREPR